MNSGEKSAIEIFGFGVAIFALICFGAAVMSAVNVLAGFREGHTSTYLTIAIVALVLAILLGLLAGYLMSWADPKRRGLTSRK